MTILKNIKQAVIKRTHNVTVDLGIRCGSPEEAKAIATEILTLAAQNDATKRWRYAAVRAEVTKALKEAQQ